MDRESAPFRIHALGLLAMGSILSIMMTSPVISLYLVRRGLPPVHVGLVIGIMSLSLVAAELLALGVTSVLGRRRTVVASLAGGAVMLAWFPLTVSLVGLYLTRLLLGAVRGVWGPVLFSEVAEAAPPDRRTATFAILWFYFGVGLLVGPALGGLLGERISLSAPFYAAAVGSLLTIPAAFAIRPLRDSGARNPLISYGVLRRHPAVVRVWLLTVCNVTTFGVYSTFLPLHAAAHGLTPTQIGLIFSAGSLAFSLGQGLLGRTAERAAGRLLILGFVVRGVGIAVVPLLASFPALLTVNFLTGVIGAVIPSALSMRIAEKAPREHLMAAMGGFNAAADAGFFLGPVLGGLLAGLGLQWAFLMVIPVTAASLLLLHNQAGAPATAGASVE